MEANDFVFRLDKVDTTREFPFRAANAAAARHGFESVSIYSGGAADPVGLFRFVLARSKSESANKVALADDLALIVGRGTISSAAELSQFRKELLRLLQTAIV
jgi:hypothetical protein